MVSACQHAASLSCWLQAFEQGLPLMVKEKGLPHKDISKFLVKEMAQEGQPVCCSHAARLPALFVIHYFIAHTMIILPLPNI